jgi:hypothetical protein
MSADSDYSFISEGSKVIVLSVDGKNNEDILSKLECKVKPSGSVELNSLQTIDKVSPSTQDCIVVSSLMDLDSLNLDQCLRVLKTNGTICCTQLKCQSDARAESVFTLNGFVQIKVSKVSSDQQSTVRKITASKPSYEVGASVPLKLSSNKSEAAKAWTLNSNDMLDDDIMNSDDILDEADLVKPNPASLKAACGISAASRKACKNCTCGLAEELESEKAEAELKTKSAEAKSSCGNCYLGDAFRCASCPYRGLPAFKPGEKVQIPVHSDI